MLALQEGLLFMESVFHNGNNFCM